MHGPINISLLTYVNLCNTDTTQTQPHQISNTQQTENKTTDVVIQQHSRKLLMMDMLMSELCWVHKKWNKIASDIKLVLYSSTITIMQGPINIRHHLIFAHTLFNLHVRSCAPSSIVIVYYIYIYISNVTKIFLLFSRLWRVERTTRNIYILSLM